MRDFASTSKQLAPRADASRSTAWAAPWSLLSSIATTPPGVSATATAGMPNGTSDRSTAGGNTMEYTTELEQIDEDTWHPHLYDFTRPEVSDQWGTANTMNEFVAKRSFNDPDKGLFVAPPV